MHGAQAYARARGRFQPGEGNKLAGEDNKLAGEDNKLAGEGNKTVSCTGTATAQRPKRSAPDLDYLLDEKRSDD
jgi:hypothetical protein